MVSVIAPLVALYEELQCLMFNDILIRESDNSGDVNYLFYFIIRLMKLRILT